MRWLPPLLLLAVAAVWATSLGAGFVFDDIADVVENTAAQAATFFQRLPTTLRPLLKASYALQDWLHGPWAPGFHALNVVLHVACCALVYALLRRWLRSAADPSIRPLTRPAQDEARESVDKPTDLILSSPAQPRVPKDRPESTTSAAFSARPPRGCWRRSRSWRRPTAARGWPRPPPRGCRRASSGSSG